MQKRWNSNYLLFSGLWIESGVLVKVDQHFQILNTSWNYCWNAHRLTNYKSSKAGRFHERWPIEERLPCRSSTDPQIRIRQWCICNHARTVSGSGEPKMPILLRNAGWVEASIFCIFIFTSCLIHTPTIKTFPHVSQKGFHVSHEVRVSALAMKLMAESAPVLPVTLAEVYLKVSSRHIQTWKLPHFFELWLRNFLLDTLKYTSFGEILMLLMSSKKQHSKRI